MNILVIGNGFDIAHGLPTKYGNFLEFAKFMEDFSSKGSNTNAISCNINSFSNSGAKEVFEKAKEYGWNPRFVNSNLWASYFDQKSRKNQNSRWVDFEAEISEKIQFFEKWLTYERKNEGLNKNSGSYSAEDKDKENYYLSELKGLLGPNRVSLFNYKAVVKKWEDDLNEFILHLEKYLELVMHFVNLDKKLEFIASGSYDNILSFNYTDTYERIYRNKTKACNFHYIHGKINNEYVAGVKVNNMVLGIEEYLTDDEKNRNKEFIWFKKYFQRIYKKTGNNYKMWLATKTRQKNYITIIGHSLALTDKDIFRELIMNQNISKTTIYYFDEKSYRDQIANLVEIIGQDTLIEKVNNESLVFIEQPEKMV